MGSVRELLPFHAHILLSLRARTCADDAARAGVIDAHCALSDHGDFNLHLTFRLASMQDGGYASEQDAQKGGGKRQFSRGDSMAHLS